MIASAAPSVNPASNSAPALLTSKSGAPASLTMSTIRASIDRDEVAIQEQRLALAAAVHESDVESEDADDAELADLASEVDHDDSDVDRCAANPLLDDEAEENEEDEAEADDEEDAELDASVASGSEGEAVSDVQDGDDDDDDDDVDDDGDDDDADSDDQSDGNGAGEEREHDYTAPKTANELVDANIAAFFQIGPRAEQRAPMQRVVQGFDADDEDAEEYEVEGVTGEGDVTIDATSAAGASANEAIKPVDGKSEMRYVVNCVLY